ncbi:hypothetical protein [Rubinisphaera sp. JC750]|uniref:hypothetical protein n=1 Tax=Rubinisphaera sp. JC750 TaxID=2898658 RepID=UPI001F386EC6|nr:hypothetical protein [Rubinisphaera sp. JC750]
MDNQKLPVVKADGTFAIPDMDTSGLSLVFIPETEDSPNAWTQVGSDGKFEVSTYEAGDGAVVGKYKVIVSGGDGPMEEDDPRMARIPSEFKNRTKSSWNVEVTADPESNHFDLKI